jgi:hypothetical protein
VGVSSSEWISKSISPISKAGHFDVKIETAERQIVQLLGQQSLVPGRIFRQLMSAILKARTCAGVKWSRHKVGTSSLPSSPQASSRPCPAITLPSGAIRIGTLKPNALMLLAICYRATDDFPNLVDYQLILKYSHTYEFPNNWARGWTASGCTRIKYYKHIINILKISTCMSISLLTWDARQYGIDIKHECEEPLAVERAA